MNHLYYLEDIVFVTFFTVGTKQKQVDGGRAVVEYQTGRQQYLESATNLWLIDQLIFDATVPPTTFNQKLL